MEAVYEHVQENMVGYIVLAVVLLAVTVAFRKYTLPAIFYTIETSIYIVVFHTVFTGMVRFASWFRSQTEIRSTRATASQYTGEFFTPMKEFWRKDLYSPEWLYYFEIAVIVAIIIIVIRYRPTAFGRKNKYRSTQNVPGGKKPSTSTYGSRTGTQFPRQTRPGQTRSGQTRSGQARRR